MSDFDSLTWALEDWFDTPLSDLPHTVRQRVERDFIPMPWDSLSADERRIVALQWDYQHDPVTEQDQQCWWDFFQRKSALKKQIVGWEAVGAPTAGELAQKEKRLAELPQELARMELQERHTRGDYYPERKSLDGEGGAPSTSREPIMQYIAYPKAMKRLAERLKATPEEIAAWIFMGPKNGGLTAYLNANELDPPPQFYYGIGSADDFDYLSPLMACWFREDDIANFEPANRYITGKVLIARWSTQPGIQPEAFIRAKITESRLMDIHPICGCTQGTFPQDASYPPMTSGLFVLSHVEKIEAEDFGRDPVGESVSITTDPNEPPVVGSPEWRTQNARAAADARHSQPGGSREKQQQLRDLWASGKYDSRDRCAEEECRALGMSFAAARRALANTPDPQRT